MLRSNYLSKIVCKAISVGFIAAIFHTASAQSLPGSLGSKNTDCGLLKNSKGPAGMQEKRVDPVIVGNRGTNLAEYAMPSSTGTGSNDDIVTFYYYSGRALLDKIEAMSGLDAAPIWKTLTPAQMTTFFTSDNVYDAAQELETLNSNVSVTDDLVRKLTNLLRFLQVADYRAFYNKESVPAFSSWVKPKVASALWALSTNTNLWNYSTANNIFPAWRKAEFAYTYFTVAGNWKVVASNNFAILKHGAALVANQLSSPANLFAKDDNGATTNYFSILLAIENLNFSLFSREGGNTLSVPDNLFRAFSTYFQNNYNTFLNNNNAVYLKNTFLEAARYGFNDGMKDRVRTFLRSVRNLTENTRPAIQLFDPSNHPDYAVLYLNGINNLGDRCADYNFCYEDLLRRSVLNSYRDVQLTGGVQARIFIGNPKTAADLDRIEARLIDAKQRYHTLTGTSANNPVADDHTTNLEMYVFTSPDDYRSFAGLWGNTSTNNGGITLEGDPSTPGNTSKIFMYYNSSTDALPWNLEHEFCHFLDGKYINRGDFSTAYDGSDYATTFFEEGLAEYFMCSQYQYQRPHVAWVRNNWNDFRYWAQTDKNAWNDNSSRIYDGCSTAMRYIFNNNASLNGTFVFTAMKNLLQAGNYPGFDTYVRNTVGSNFDQDFYQWIWNRIPNDKYLFPSGSTAREIAGVEEIHSQNHGDFCKVYPVPSAGHFNLDISKTENLPVTIKAYNLNGKLVESIPNTFSAHNNFGENWTPGVYIIEVQSGDIQQKITVVKQ